MKCHWDYCQFKDQHNVIIISLITHIYVCWLIHSIYYRDIKKTSFIPQHKIVYDTIVQHKKI